ncbi:MAG: thioesterase family protein [Candidatus Omnitrophica bacterium]|jgi:acyl-CoA thioester hydrolase|nr:thioesterase family protein [Candidatus Omnitrophota bacterium]
MAKHTAQLRVRYKETDRMGVAYYSNYFVWFEVARTELLRKAGCPYTRIESDMGLRLMVVRAQCCYRMPARYDDLLDIDCFIPEVGNTSVTFACNIFRGDDLLAEGSTVHVCTDVLGKPRRIPQALKDALA